MAKDKLFSELIEEMYCCVENRMDNDYDFDLYFDSDFCEDELTPSELFKFHNYLRLRKVWYSLGKLQAYILEVEALGLLQNEK